MHVTFSIFKSKEITTVINTLKNKMQYLVAYTWSIEKFSHKSTCTFYYVTWFFFVNSLSNYKITYKYNLNYVIQIFHLHYSMFFFLPCVSRKLYSLPGANLIVCLIHEVSIYSKVYNHFSTGLFKNTDVARLISLTS